MHHHCHPGAWHFAGRRRFGAFANESGPFGPGFGRGGHRGPFRGGKMLGDGELRLVVLALLADQPRHGYDIIKALEERSHGAYSPSPGVVYPTLTFLEEAGYTTAATEGAKKVYAITDAGRAHLAENREVADMVLDGMDRIGEKMARARAWYYRHEDAAAGDIPGFSRALNEARRSLKQALAEALDAPEAEQERIAGILRDATAAIRGKAD